MIGKQILRHLAWMLNKKPHFEFGHHTAEQLQPKTPYELSNGNFIECMPTGGRGAKKSTYGANVLATDPEVESAGIDTGYAINHNTVRAPDVSIGNVPDQPGWVTGGAIVSGGICRYWSG